MHLNSDTEELA